MPDRQPPSFWDRVKEAPLWVKVVVPIVLLIAVISAIPTSEDNGGDRETASESTSPTQPTLQPPKCRSSVGKGVSEEDAINCAAEQYAYELASNGATKYQLGYANATAEQIERVSSGKALVTLSNGCKVEVTDVNGHWTGTNSGGPRLAGGCEHGVKFPETKPAAAPPAAQPPAAPAAAPGPTEDDLRDALDDADPTNYGAVADSLDIKDIELFPAVANITVETPEGGLEGASVADLDGSAAAALEAIYGDADWQRGATVKFIGGLVNSRTGQDLPNAETGLYRVTAKEAQQIDWDNASAVDWSFYRLFAHPALKD